MIKALYHTQENRKDRLLGPIPCYRDDAWLGEACYFWDDIEDAEMWGNKSKRGTGYYEIYECKAELHEDRFIDTVFNEEHYRFWKSQIEKTAKKIIKLTGVKPTLKELNDFFKEKAYWEEIDAIQFQDLPKNSQGLVQPITYRNNKKTYFSYRKRIQIAIYNTNIITNFAHLKTEECLNL